MVPPLSKQIQSLRRRSSYKYRTCPDVCLITGIIHFFRQYFVIRLCHIFLLFRDPVKQPAILLWLDACHTDTHTNIQRLRQMPGEPIHAAFCTVPRVGFAEPFRYPALCLPLLYVRCKFRRTHSEILRAMIERRPAAFPGSHPASAATPFVQYNHLFARFHQRTGRH
ncbi:hypothetical protein D1872_255570 [compost metagenome]